MSENPNGHPDTTQPRTLLEQAKEAAEIARQAFAQGDNVAGIAGVKLAAELIQLEKLRQRIRGSADHG